MKAGKKEKARTSVAFLLSQVGGRAAQEFARLIAPLNFTPPDAGILRLLSLSPGISQQDLAARLNMHASRLVAIIDALEERGLVVRVANPSDRRTYALELSNQGREAFNAIGRVSQAHEEIMCQGLSNEERAQLRALLEKLATNLGLAPGIHPGYRTLGRSQDKERAPAGRNKA
jgi:DNA-binding MarR family transcriptional regulator